MNKDLLSQYYAEHHREGKKFGFIFGGNERGRLFSEWIGTGKNVGSCKYIVKNLEM